MPASTSPPPATFKDKNGNDRSWQELHTHLQRLLRKRYPRVDTDILQDALSDAMVDLLALWQSYDSSHVDEEQWNFGYALIRGMHTANGSLREAVRLKYRIESPTEQGLLTGVLDRADTAPLPDELVEELDLVDRARHLLADASVEALEDYFLLISGETEEAGAERLGIARRSYRDRKEVRSARLKRAARGFGLVG